MTAQIRPNRMQVSDRFPMLGFAIKTDRPDVQAEVVLATDISLFKTENRDRRTAANFYTSREHGLLSVPRGDGVFVVPPEVLARFIGQDRLFFGLATGAAGQARLDVDAIPREGSPYVSLSGFTGRTLRRSFTSNRANTAPLLEWSGDAASPGSEPARTSSPARGGDQRQQSSDQPVADYDDGFGDLPEIPAREAVASREMGTAEDIEHARRYAPRWQDLFNYSVPASVVNQMSGRGLSVQTIDSAWGTLNLDRYSVNCTRLPTGKTAAQVVEYLRKNINTFLDTGNTEFLPYGTQDAATIGSNNPVGGVWKLDIWGPDNAAVVICESTSNYFRVATLEAPDTGSHPVSGIREWGYAENGEAIEFYTRAADRATWGVGEFLVWNGADDLWRSLQRKLTDWINANGGAATIGGIVSERFEPSIVSIMYPGAASAAPRGQALARDPDQGNNQAVLPGLPGNARERAERIGGQFAGRIGEALDLGLQEKALGPLLSTLEGRTDPAPMMDGNNRSAPVRAQGVSTSIHWDDVQPMNQPTDMSCWATTIAMLIGWRDRVSIDARTIAQQAGKSINNGLQWTQHRSTAEQLGLNPIAPQSYTPDGFFSLLENEGPLYVSKMASSSNLSGHAVLVVGMYKKGGNYYVRVVDPWDRNVGTPGNPGAYRNTHNTGSKYILSFEDFEAEYELQAVRDGSSGDANVQIFTGGVPQGRQPNRSGTAPSGFAMAVGDSRVMDAGAIATIAGTAVQMIAQNTGDISTNLGKWQGIKHPDGVAPDNPADFRNGEEIHLRDFPTVTDSWIDDIHQDFYIRWQHNGRSVGNVYISRGEVTNDAIGWGLHVDGLIKDDAILYGDSRCAAVEVEMQYTFDHVVGSAQTAVWRIRLRGDGVIEHIEKRWKQTSLFSVEQGAGGSSWSVNWDDVQLVNQPTDDSCWATTLAMLIGWRDQISISPETIAQQCGKSIQHGLPWAERDDAAAALGLTAHAPQSYSTDGFRDLIENNGPLYVGKRATSNANSSGHAVLVVGMYCDGGDCFVRIADPWDRNVGTPENPGGYQNSHNRGSRYIMPYADFMREYELAASGSGGNTNVQILSGGVPQGRTINRGSSTPQGYAMGANCDQNLPAPPPNRSRAMDAGAVATIAGTAVQILTSNTGDITTHLASWSGVKSPSNLATQTGPGLQADKVQQGAIELRDWPLLGALFGIDDIYAWLKIRWSYDGTSLGHIYIDDIGHDDAIDWGLKVTTTIEDDSRLYPRSSQARVSGADQVPALHVKIVYTFFSSLPDDHIAESRIKLYADGTYDIDSRWIQHQRPGGGTPTVRARPMVDA